MITRQEVLVIASLIRNCRPEKEDKPSYIMWESMRDELIPFLQLRASNFDVYSFRMLTEMGKKAGDLVTGKEDE